MLSPEVWEFNPPSNSIQIKTNISDISVIDKCVNSHFFNHLVSVVLPDTPSPPSSVEDSLCFDCDYYKVIDLDLSHLLHEDFIKGFVKKGDISLMSIGTHLDVDDCVALTPSGHLVLSLRREIYQELGLEGTPTFTKERTPQRYKRKIKSRELEENRLLLYTGICPIFSFCTTVFSLSAVKTADRFASVIIDLAAESFKPGKPNYEKTYKAINERLPVNFTVAVAWDPPDDKVCPSSIAAYFASCDLNVSLCSQKLSRNLRYGVAVPSLDSVRAEPDVEEFLEWLGAVSIGVPLDKPSDRYLSCYQCSLEEKESSCVAVLTWSGFFTRKQIAHLLEELRHIINERKTLPWISLHVQGFEDSPVSWGLKEHRFYTDGDNSYTIIIDPSSPKICVSNLSNQRLLK